MLNAAMTKIKTEMEQNASNPYILVVGQFLIQFVSEHPDSAEKILIEGKTIGSSLNEMKKAAEKKKVGNCAVLTDQEGFDIVLKYFGIESTVQASSQPTPIFSEVRKDIVMQTDDGMSFDIEDFI